MKYLFSILFLTAQIHAQVAADANKTYQTEQGRAGVAAGLDGPDRDSRQKPKELIAALGIQPGMTVADVGTGVGYMLPFLSAATGAGGAVIAEDIFPDYLAKAREKAEKNGLKNVKFIHGKEDDPKLGTGVDLVLILDVYHHFDYPGKMLASIAASLKPGGRVAIVDYYKRKGAMGGADSTRALTHIRLDEADLVKEIESFGFTVISAKPFLPGVQYLAIFSKK
jgi:SAM-dependent methyltransferase